MIEKMESFFGVQKVKSQLLFWFILLLFLLFLLTVIPYYIIESKDRKSSTLEELSNQVHIEGKHVEHWLMEKKKDIELFASMADTISTNENNEDTLWIYRNLLLKNNELQTVHKVNANGQPEFRINKIENQIKYDTSISESVVNKKFFTEAINGKTYVSEVHNSDEEDVLTISTPIKTQGNITGVLYTELRLSSLELLFTNKRNSDTYMVSRSGQILASSGDRNESIEDSYLFKRAILNQPVQEAYQSPNGKLFGSYQWINDQNWLIVSERKKSDMFSSLYIQLFIFCMNIIVIFAIGFLLFMAIAERINQPLHMLTESAINIRNGNWDYFMDKQVYKRSGYEFNVLALSFLSMVEQLKQSVKSMRKAQHQYKNIVDHVKEVVYQIDSKGRWTFLNPAWETLSGYTINEALDKPFMFFVHEEDRLKMYRTLKPLIENETSFVRSKIRYRQKDGSERIVEFYCNVLRDEHGEVECYTGAIHDITEWVHAEERLQEANRKLEEMSYMDSLTSVPNRRLLDIQMKRKIDKALLNQSPLTFMMLDIDFFKKYNDTYGHLAGDDCLAYIATKLKEITDTNNGFVARYGGEEFAIIYEGITREEAEWRAEALRAGIESLQLAHTGSEVCDYVTISIGVHHSVPSEFDTISAFVSKADQALYEAKENGKNQYYLKEKVR